MATQALSKFLTGVYKPLKWELEILEKWIQQLKENSFFPYHKIEEKLDGGDITAVFVNGVMDDGKSYKSWQYVLYHYLKYGEKTQVLYPLTASMEEEMAKFLEDFKMDCPKLWDNVRVIALDSKGNSRAVLYRDYLMAYVNTLPTLIKTSRDKSVKHLLIDEYNQHDTRVRNMYIEKYNLLLSRNLRGLKKVFLGNNVTTDHVLLHYYNVFVLPDGMTDIPIEYKDYNGVWKEAPYSITVWNYKRSTNEILDKYKNIPEFYELNMGKFGAHAFFNESRQDQRDFIIDLDTLLKDQLTLRYLVPSRIGVLEVYKWFFEADWYFYIRYDRKNSLTLKDAGRLDAIPVVLTKEYEESGHIASKKHNIYFYNLKGSKIHKYRYQNASVAKAFQEQLGKS